MKVTFIPIVIGALGTVIKGLIKGLEVLEIRGQVETMQTIGIGSWRKNFAEVKIQKGIFQGDVLAPLLFMIAMMPLNKILKKCTTVGGEQIYKITKKINHINSWTSNCLQK